MSRAERLKRINDVLAAGERRARKELASANRELAAADAGIRSVVEQCRQAGAAAGGDSGSDLSVQAGLAVVQTGLAEAADREADRRVASDEVADKSESWRIANNRHEAATRLLDRWRVESEAESKWRATAEVDASISARAARRLGRGRPSNALATELNSPEAEDGLQ